MFIYLFIYLFVCLFVCLVLYLIIDLFIYLFAFTPSNDLSRKHEIRHLEANKFILIIFPRFIQLL